ncbi:MAG: hypothetical protein KGL35_25630 [Bradyrhizobium sp.]|nr:hypothetical protein [Bradyrhizobium sp.]
MTATEARAWILSLVHTPLACIVIAQIGARATSAADTVDASIAIPPW